VFKEFLPGVLLLIGLCAASAALQTLHIIDQKALMAGQLALKLDGCDCDACQPVVRPTR
jgi:hypothetical protein